MEKSFNSQLKNNSAKGLRFGIVVSNWNKDVTHSLLNKTIETLLNFGTKKSDIFKKEVPGAFELIYGARKMSKEKIDAIIVIGCIIEGETPHFKYISNSVTTGIKDLNIVLKKPVIFGVNNKKFKSSRTKIYRKRK